MHITIVAAMEVIGITVFKMVKELLAPKLP